MTAISPDTDILIVGGGIVGLATGLALTRASRATVTLIEAESEPAFHQTGRNSGVIHSGLYYKPGSLKATNCVKGREKMFAFCREHGVPHERTGKLVVATNESQLPHLEELERRGHANGLRGLQRMAPAEMHAIEPNVGGVAGLFVPETGIVDFTAAAHAMAKAFAQAGGTLITSHRFLGLRNHADRLEISTNRGTLTCRGLVNCAGLQCDRVARACGVEPPVRIVPFKGEYYSLPAGENAPVRGLIYPVPDPSFPFLGVHFTRRVTGEIEAGPNAVLAFKREGYEPLDWSTKDLAETLSYGGFLRMAFKHWKMGLAEQFRSWCKPAFVRELQKLVPTVESGDLVPGGCGIRAQAVTPDGALADDFILAEGPRSLHVLNAPSPAATASLSIGEEIATRALRHFERQDETA